MTHLCAITGHISIKTRTRTRVRTRTRTRVRTRTRTRTRTRHTLDWSQLMTRACTRQPGLAVRRPGKDLISRGVDSDSDFWFLLLIFKF
jgi:hypothetical protein